MQGSRRRKKKKKKKIDGDKRLRHCLLESHRAKRETDFSRNGDSNSAVISSFHDDVSIQGLMLHHALSSSTMRT